MIAAFRMYNAVPAAAAAWRALFERVFAELALPIPVIDHGWPHPIAQLWARADLACGFMCGWPFVRSGQMLPIAAPVPSPPRYEGLPRYCSEFLVRGGSAARAIEDTFGERIGWMAEDSQSGFNAPRAFLSRYVSAERPALFAQSRGPLGTPLRTLEALVAGEVDVVALDSFFLDLLRHHDAARLQAVRCVATTPWTPIPMIVAAPGTEAALVETLRARLLTLHEDAAYAPLLAPVLLQRFVAPDVPAYGVLEEMARTAVARNYEAIR